MTHISKTGQSAQAKKNAPQRQRKRMVRAKGIEPSSSAWEADVLPLYHARNLCVYYTNNLYQCPEQRNKK